MKKEKLVELLTKAIVTEEDLEKIHAKTKGELPREPTIFQVYNVGNQEETTRACEAYRISALVIIDIINDWATEWLPEAKEEKIIDLVTAMNREKGVFEFCLRTEIKEDRLVSKF